MFRPHKPGKHGVNNTNNISDISSIMKKAEEAVREFRMASVPNEQDGIRSDVLGSYTGTAYDGSEPVQDADDL